jgi:hypothetical protein
VKVEGAGGWGVYILARAPKLQTSGDWSYCRRRQYVRSKNSSSRIGKMQTRKEVAFSKFWRGVVDEVRRSHSDIPRRREKHQLDQSKEGMRR